MGNTGTLGDDGTSCEYLFDQAAETNYMAEDDLFAIFESLDSVILLDDNHHRPCKEAAGLVSQKSSTSSSLLPSQDSDDHQLVETTSSPKSKRQKTAAAAVNSSDNEAANDGQQRMSHISVERNRRKQMNEHLSVLRSLMPCFYVKRGDQASIIGGVVDYVNELQQVLQSLEAKKQRKVYSEVLSPRLAGVSSSSPRPSPILSPRKPPLSPRLNLPVSPRTPQPGSSYKPAARLQQHQQAAAAASAGGYLSPTSKPNTANNNSSAEPSPCSSSSASSVDTVNELVANSKSAAADVEVKFSGANLVLKTVSPRIPGQALKIISVLEDLAFEILHVSISTVDETMHNFFTIKIGIECQLSAEELAQQIHQTFC